MNNIYKLKPCPLCGSDATIAHFMPEDEHAVICFDCFNESDKYETVAKAIEEWNRRR